MSRRDRPNQTGSVAAQRSTPNGGDGDLDDRRRDLEAALAARRPRSRGEGGSKSSGRSDFANALRLSSEFIAGVLVGAGLGWFIDRMAGSSPWGLIVFLLLGFAAGVLNVLRSAGLLAQPGPASERKGRKRPDGN